jgi:hypothetical protein
MVCGVLVAPVALIVIAAEYVPGGRQGRTPELRSRSRRIDERDLETRLRSRLVAAAEHPEERERFPVTAEQKVLAVVERLAGLRIAALRACPVNIHELLPIFPWKAGV